MTAVEAVPGLGEALVAGQVTPDTYRVRDGAIVDRERSAERPAAAVTDAQVLELDALAVVQSRPITTLFPIPEVDDDASHVYVSVGHQQMMTEPMAPLGLSVWQLTALRPMYVAENLASPRDPAAIPEGLGRSDLLTRDALETVIAREGFLASAPEDDGDPLPIPGAPGAPPLIDTDHELVLELVRRTEESLAATAEAIVTETGTELLDFILDDLPKLRTRLSMSESLPDILTAMEAAFWLNDHVEEWLGEANVVDARSQSVPGNVTSSIGLALLDVADVGPDGGGGQAAADAIRGYLDDHGVRCVGEIDLTRPRWSESPSTLVPLILSNVDNLAPGERERRFTEGLRVATEKEHEVLERLRALPDGEAKAAETKAMIDRVRTFAGYREYPKFPMISRYWIYKQALWPRPTVSWRPAWWMHPTTSTASPSTSSTTSRARRGGPRPDPPARREEFLSYAALTPPRVLTSEGEALHGSYRRDDVPDGALVGLAVSARIVEGRARVILDLADAHDLAPGDILVTNGTDPSWSPVFVAVAGLVTEVGGLMTHGAMRRRHAAPSSPSAAAV